MAPSDPAVKISEDDAAPAKAADISTDAGADTIVPITRDFLKAFYAQYPDPQLSGEFTTVRAAVNVQRGLLNLPPVVAVPKRMDECMYAIRCECEESGISDLLAVGAAFAGFQDAQRAHVSEMVARFLPADFRGWLFNVARQQSEAKNSAAVTELMKSGGTVREKYALLWKQQWTRRETLSMVGNASGIWKLAVKFIAGVPQALLDFARDINVPDGPTEELRAKFGPVLTQLVEMATECNQLKQAGIESDNVAGMEALDEGTRVLRKESEAFCELLTRVVEHSPFFVPPGEIERLKAKTAEEKKK